jgi:hypothetical protein
MIKPKLIAISGAARSGKNLFANLLINELNKQNIKSCQFSLANELKVSLNSFLLEKYNISAFTEKTEEKDIIRQILVDTAAKNRKDTNGRFYLEKINNDILLCLNNNIVPILTDLRFAEFKNDELFWAKNELNGIIVHIKKFYIRKNQSGDCFIERQEYPNKQESTNDPIIEKNSDYSIIWPDFNNQNIEEQAIVFCKNQINNIIKTLYVK